MQPIIGVSAASTIPCDGRLRYYLNASYVESVVRAGGAPLLIPPGLEPDALEAIWGHLDGLLLTGGHDLEPTRYGEAPHPDLGPTDPPRDRTELWLARRALDADLPALGVCRGMQTLNVATGGTLWQDLPSQWTEPLVHNHPESSRDDVAHTLLLDPASRLAAILGVELGVNSYQHQAVKEVGAGFTVVGRSPDGIAEAMEHPGRRFVLAVQFHPEDMPESAPCRRLLRALAEAVAGVSGRQPVPLR